MNSQEKDLYNFILNFLPYLEINTVVMTHRETDEAMRKLVQLEQIVKEKDLSNSKEEYDCVAKEFKEVTDKFRNSLWKLFANGFMLGFLSKEELQISNPINSNAVLIKTFPIKQEVDKINWVEQFEILWNKKYKK